MSTAFLLTTFVIVATPGTGVLYTLAAGLSEPRDTIEEVIEPYLIQLGLVARTARGRCLNDAGWTHLDMRPPPASTGQNGLFDQAK